MRQTGSPAGLIRFGVFEVDTVTGELRKQGLRIRLQEQPFQVLALLLARPGELVTREELHLKLWPAGTFVDFEHSLNKAINKLREALGDDSDSPRYIETLPRRGYRFIAPIAGDKQPEDSIGFPDIKATPPISGVIGNPHRIQWMKPFLILLLGVFVLIAAVLLYEQAHNQTKPATVMHVAASNHSVAVLPLMNLSDDASQNYFADAMTDELITVLSQISALHVISRTSVMHYKQTTKTLPQIGRELGVATILEGSVQKSGNQVLINLRLIDVATEDDLWSETYKRPLKNIFGVEVEVATNVAGALSEKLTPAEASRISSLPTQNPRAYDLFLQGEYYQNRAGSSILSSDFDSAIQKFREATEQDPQFALAYARMALMQLFESRYKQINQQLVIASIKNNIDMALKLAPNLAEAHLAQGYYEAYVMHNLDAALTELELAQVLKPHDPDIIFAIGIINKHRDQLGEAIKYYKQALTYDPRNLFILGELTRTYEAQRHYGDAERVAMQGLTINPESSVMLEYLSDSILLQTGNLNRAQAVLDTASESLQSNPQIILNRINLMLEYRNYPAAIALINRLSSSKDVPAFIIESRIGDVDWAAGDQAKARQHYLQAAALIEAELKANPINSYSLHGTLGQIYARLGYRRKALEQGRLYIKLVPVYGQLLTVSYSLWNMAQIQAELGNAGAAVPLLARVLTMPNGGSFSVELLKLDPIWDPIRNDPRFQALLKEHGNANETAVATRGG